MQLSLLPVAIPQAGPSLSCRGPFAVPSWDSDGHIVVLLRSNRGPRAAPRRYLFRYRRGSDNRSSQTLFGPQNPVAGVYTRRRGLLLSRHLQDSDPPAAYIHERHGAASGGSAFAARLKLYQQQLVRVI